MIKQAGVLQIKKLISIGCTRKTTTTTTNNQMLWFHTSYVGGYILHWMYPPTCLLSWALAAIPKCVFSHLCKQKSAYNWKTCFWVCNHPRLTYVKVMEESTLSIMCEIYYMKSCLILQTISVLIYMWLWNTMWQEQLVTFRTSKLCRKSGAIIGKTFRFS